MTLFLFETFVLAFAVKYDQLLDVLIAAIVLGAAGLIIFGTIYFVLHLVMPFSIRKEIEERQNPALGIVIGAILIGIAIIIAAAI